MPIQQDFLITRQPREAGQLVDLPLQDQVIVGRRAADSFGRGYYSFREAEML